LRPQGSPDPSPDEKSYEAYVSPAQGKKETLFLPAIPVITRPHGLTAPELKKLPNKLVHKLAYKIAMFRRTVFLPIKHLLRPKPGRLQKAISQISWRSIHAILPLLFAQ
jgi:hypothetical protein